MAGGKPRRAKARDRTEPEGHHGHARHVRDPMRADEQAIYFTWADYNDPALFPSYVEKNGASYRLVPAFWNPVL